MAKSQLGCPCNVNARGARTLSGLAAWPRAVGFGALGVLGAPGGPGIAAANAARAAAAMAAQAAQASSAATSTASIAAPTPVVTVPAGSPVNPNYAAPPVVVVTPSQLSNIQGAVALVNSGTDPTAPQGAAFVQTVLPQQPVQQTVALPVASGGGSSTSNLSGLGNWTARRTLMPNPIYRGPALRRMQLGSLGSLGLTQGQATISTGAGIAAGAAAGAAWGSVVPGIGNAVGAAVGAIVGLVEGLFSAKKAIPHVTQQDIAQATQWYNQYKAIAGTVVGRNFSASAIQDIITASAILDPGFWGDSSSTQISIPAVQNYYGEVMARVKYFMTALAAVNVGQTVTLRDISSLPGHGSTNMNVSYSFTSPGINAPSYVLGPLFAQYFYTMCAIFVPAADCTNHLNPPLPQFYSDLIDYVRAGTSWDTPQPNVVIGADTLTAAAPAETISSSGQAVGPAEETAAVVPVCIAPAQVAQASANPQSVNAPAPVVISTPQQVAITPPTPVTPSIVPVNLSPPAPQTSSPVPITFSQPTAGLMTADQGNLPVLYSGAPSGTPLNSSPVAGFGLEIPEWALWAAGAVLIYMAVKK